MDRRRASIVGLAVALAVAAGLALVLSRSGPLDGEDEARDPRDGAGPAAVAGPPLVATADGALATGGRSGAPAAAKGDGPARDLLPTDAAREGVGIVVDDAERPVADAAVERRTREGVPVLRVTTGRDGRFRLPLPAGERGAWCRASASGFVHRGAEAFVEAGRETRIVLVPACPLRVRLLDAATAAPVAGASVRAVSGEVLRAVFTHALDPAPSDEAVTDARGAATLSTEGGPAALIVQPREHAPVTVRGISVPRDGTDVEVRLARGGTVEGTLRDASGAGVAGASLRLDVVESYRREATTDGAGRFRFANVPLADRGDDRFDGEFDGAWIVARAAGWPTTRFDLASLPEPGATTHVELTLVPGVQVEGRVVAADARGLGALRVESHRLDGRSSRGDDPAPVAVAPDGTFAVGPLPAGSWWFAVVDAVTFRHLVARTVTVPDDVARGPLTLTLPDRSGTFSVRVLDAQGGAVGGAEVKVSAALGSVVTEVGSVGTDASGHARLDGVPREGVTALVSAPASAPVVVRPTTTDLAAGRLVVVTLPSGEASGRVVRLDGSPARVRLHLLTIYDGCGDYGPVVETDADGAFRFRHLPVGEAISVSVEDDAWTLVGGDVEVRAGDEGLRWVAVRRDEQARLHVALVLVDAATGFPVPVALGTVSVEVLGERGFGRRIAADPGSANEEGRFVSAEPLAPGIYELSVVAEGYRTVRLPRVVLPRNGDPAVVRLVRGASLRGRVEDAAGSGIDDVRVRVADRTATTDPRGMYVVDGLDEGRVTVELEGRYVRSRTTSAVLAGTQPTTLDVRLVRTAAVRVEATGAGAARGSWTAAVEVVPVAGGPSCRGTLAGVVRSAADVAFADVVGVEPGRVRVVVTREGRTSAPVEVDAPVGATTTVSVPLP